MKRIAQGENVLVRRDLKRVDGSDLLLIHVAILQAEIIQEGSVIEILSYPSPRLRQGLLPNQVELEIVTDTSNRFKKGRVAIRWTIVCDSTLFLAERIQKDIITEDVLDVR
jgi:hypothetical protein